MVGWVVAAISQLFRAELLSTFRLAWVFIDVLNMCMAFNFTRRLADTPLTYKGRPASFHLPHAVMAAYAVYIPALGYATHVTGEALSLAFLLAALNVIDLDPPFRLKRMAPAGLLAGLMIITRPNLAPFALAMGGVLFLLNFKARPFFRQIIIPIALFVSMAVVPAGAWVARNYAVTGYVFLNLSYPNGGYRASLAAYEEDLRLLDSDPRQSEVEAHEKLVAKQQTLNEYLAKVVAAKSREERVRVLKEGYLNYTPVTPKEVMEGKTQAILSVSPDRKLIDAPEFVRRAITRIGRALCPKNGSFDLISRSKGLTDPVKFSIFTLANLEWSWVLFGGIASLLSTGLIAPKSRILITTVILGGMAAIPMARGEPRYSFPIEFALMIGSIAFLFSIKATLLNILHSKWKLAFFIIMLGFIGMSWIAGARWGFSDAIRGSW
jgi:hypothetical protein